MAKTKHQRMAEVNSVVEDILDEYRKLYGEDSESINDVIKKIDDISQTKNVQMCRNLNTALIKFKKRILTKIDQFEGRVFNS